MLRISARLGAILVLSALPLFGQERDSRIRGPLRFRNSFPLALHFLAFPAEDPNTLRRGESSWQLDLTTATDLSSLSHELMIGMRAPIDRHLEWVVAFTENYGTFKSSPDAGVHLAVAWRRL